MEQKTIKYNRVQEVNRRRTHSISTEIAVSNQMEETANFKGEKDI